MKATCGSITDRGLNPRRPENQDNLLVWPERGLYLVADGVGGRQGGATASALVVEVFERVFSQEMDGALTESLGELLEKTIAHCNEKIYFDAQQTPSLKGMATTIAAVAVEGRRAVVAHVGDSRVYRFDAHGLIQLTEDHTDVNEAVRTGRLSREEATHHPRRHVLNRALGAEAEVEVEQIEIELDEQTSLLLCTDGITIHLDEEELEQILQSRHPPQVICEQLRERCYLAGAEDNLTVILVDFGERLYSESEDEEEGAALAASPARREIVEAEDGGKGFIELLQFHPHLVFCDIHMQPVDGIEFLRIVRGADTKSVAATRVIFLTADAQRDTVMSAKDLSVDGYLVKPVSLHRLQAKLHETRILMPELQ